MWEGVRATNQVRSSRGRVPWRKRVGGPSTVVRWEVTRQRAAAPRPTGSVPKMHLGSSRNWRSWLGTSHVSTFLGHGFLLGDEDYGATPRKCNNVCIILPFTSGDRRSPKSTHRPKVVNLRPRGCCCALEEEEWCQEIPDGWFNSAKVG